MSLIDTVKADHGVLVNCSLERFLKGDWFLDQKSNELCYVCGSNLLVYRRSYNTSSGKLYHYWGIVCLGCKNAFHPDDLDEKQKKRIYEKHKIHYEVVESKKRLSKYLCILANSIKNQQFCIAGIELVKTQEPKWQNTSRWVRPISHRPNGAISYSESFLKNIKREPRLFDIVKLSLYAPANVPGQPEDWLIEPSSAWQYQGSLNPLTSVNTFLERPISLWLQENEKRDRVTPDWVIHHELPSLYFVEPKQLRIYIKEHHYGGEVKRSRRAVFNYGGIVYDLGMTDPIISRKYFSDFSEHQAGLHAGITLDCAAICVSLAPAWKGELAMQAYHFKLVAGVIEKNE